MEFNPLSLNLKTKTDPQPAFRIRAYTTGRDWYYDITTGQGEDVKWSAGPLPQYYENLEWTTEAASFYALAQAARYIRANHPAARVVMTNISQPSPVYSQRGREQRRWAA